MRKILELFSVQIKMMLPEENGLQYKIYSKFVGKLFILSYKEKIQILKIRLIYIFLIISVY